MANGQAFRFWHKQERVAGRSQRFGDGGRAPSQASKSTVVTNIKEKSDKSQLVEHVQATSSHPSRPKSNTSPKRAGRSSSYSPPVRIKFSSAANRNQGGGAHGYTTPQTIGVVTTIKEKLEYGHRKGQLEGSMVTGATRKLSLPNSKATRSPPRPVRTKMSFEINRNQKDEAQGRTLLPTTGAGVVTGSMKQRWEHGYDKPQLEGSMVATGNQSLPRNKVAHRRAGRSSSFSPPVRTKLSFVIRERNSDHDLDCRIAGRTVQSRPGDTGESSPRGNVRGLTKKFELSIPSAEADAYKTRISSVPGCSPVTAQIPCDGESKRSNSITASLTLGGVNDTKSSAVKIKSSGFKCHIDGPMDDPPPPSPSRKVSDLLKSVDIPEEMNFTTAPTFSIDTVEFWEMVSMLSKKSGGLSQERLSYLTAPVLSQQLETSMSDRHSSISMKSADMVTVTVVASHGCPSITFQCPQKSSVSYVLEKTSHKLKDSSKRPKDLILKVCGRDEYLENHQLLCDYEYVQRCRKFSTEVKFIVANKIQTKHVNKVTAVVSGQDTTTNQELVSQKEINNLLGSFYTTEMRFRSIVTAKDVANFCTSVLALAQSVVSCIKLICERLAAVEPPKLTEAVYEFRRACRTATQPEVETSSFYSPEDSQSFSNDFWVSIADQNFLISSEHVEDMVKALDGVKSAVHETLALYCNSFHPGYQPKWISKPKSEERSHTIAKILKIKICALHRVNEVELQKFESLQVEVSIYHGGKEISKKAHSPLAKVAKNFFFTVVWDKWLNVGIPIRSLPRESRALFILHGVELYGAGTKQSKHIISWTSLNLFDSTGGLKSGDILVGMWPEEDVDPLTSPADLDSNQSPLLQVSFEHNTKLIKFPKDGCEITEKKCSTPSPGTFRTLTNIAQKDRFYCLTSNDEELIWQSRFSCSSHLKHYPRGLPLVLLSTPYWHTDPLADIWSIVRTWPLTDATFGLELLDPQFVDIHIRTKAVEWLGQLNDDDICDILPQLVQTIQYDCYHYSAMSEFLLKRAVVSPRILHFLYWNLRLLEATNLKMKARSNLMLRAIEKLVGVEKCIEFCNQVELVDQLRTVANAVKSARDTHRQTTLIHELRGLSEKFFGEFRLPLDPALLVKGIDIESCSFFNSNTVPLKLSFFNADPFGESIDVIYKIGDDLRQDILVLQMIKVMEKIWLRAGLDLKIVTYQIVATGIEEGMLEMVTNASTLRAIQTEHGLTGSFKDKPLSEWLMRHNPTDSLYKAAVENFSLSCAGYCVATFILGICDRHNDNIMVKKSGHMFHIDFGKILGNAQMFGNIKRDRVPFVLTRDMAYVINGSDRPTEKFQRFTDLCCTAYNALRKHSSLIISLLSMMLPSGLSLLDSTDDILYVRDALLPGKSDLEATYIFTKYIDESLSSLATPLNFFIHNLAQFKFSSSTNSQAILSFCPQAYSIATDGKIKSATIVDAHKRFSPETHFVYHICVCREGSKPTHIFRRYREFHEMHTKLFQSFSDAPLPQLPGKVLVRHKSLSKQTVEKRKTELSIYLKELLELESQISESDVVYTFLHCLIRDEQDLIKLSDDKQSHTFSGKVKLEIIYNVRHQSLKVMVRHVRGLVPREGYEMTDPYVKLYLLPDHNKETKKKTKIARRTLNPTYNETFSYTIPQSALNSRNLQLSIWDASNILSNQCLCMTTIELAKIRSKLMSDTSVQDWFELQSMQDS